MKLYPKQCECPHCKTVYRYNDIKKLMWKKSAECYHCRETFGISRKSLWILALETAAVYALLNFILLSFIKGLSFFALFAVNLIPAIAAVILAPLYIEFVKDKSNKNNGH